MRIYARMQPKQYADYVDMAVNLSTTPEGDTPDGLPEVDPSAVLAEAEATIHALEAEAAKTARAARPARGNDQADASNGGKQSKRRRAAPMTGSARPDAA